MDSPYQDGKDQDQDQDVKEYSKHNEDAQVATHKEHDLTLVQALRAYPKAIIWSILLSTAVVMEGYDTLLIGSFLASTSFINTFGNVSIPVAVWVVSQAATILLLEVQTRASVFPFLKVFTFGDTVVVPDHACLVPNTLRAARPPSSFTDALVEPLRYQPKLSNTPTGSAADGTLTITAPWQSAVANGAYIGEILGLAVTGILCDRFGNKPVMTGATVLMIAFIFISFFGNTLPIQLVGQILCGIPWGVYQTVTTVYASEVLPINLRGYLTSYVNLCWVIGQFIASGVLVGFENRTDVWGWKIPYAIQWVWPLPIIAVCLLCPESPTWLVKHNKLAQAEKAVARLQSSNSDAVIPTPQETVALLQQTDAIEQHIAEGVSYRECFKGINLRRTEIATVTWTIQQMCGPVLQTYATYLFTEAGLSTDGAFDMTLGLYAIAFIGTLLSWPLINRFGRRTIFLGGLMGIFVTLMIVGFLGIVSKSNNSASWAAGAILLVFTFVYDSTVGPLTYVIVPEVSSSRLRHRTTVIARNAYNITCIWTGVLTPYMLNSTAWNWGDYAGFFWASMTAICILWTYFRLPETKGFTYAELDVLFEQGTPARSFKKSSVDVNAAYADKKAASLHEL